MTTYTIELADTYTVGMRNGASVEVVTKAVESVLADLLEYGIGQKLRDSASAATKAAEAEGSKGVTAEAQAMLDSCYASLCAGEWSHRGEGTGTDPRVLIARSIVRKAIKDKLGAKSPEYVAFTGLPDAEQLAKLDANYAANAAIFDPAIEAEIVRRANAKKDKSKLAKTATFNL